MPEVYLYNDCALDVDRRELTVAGEAVIMQPKAFELLLFLIRNRHCAVDKDELQDLLNAHGEFQQKMRQTTAATHVVGARLESDGELYRLNYTFQGGDRRPDRRTIVGHEPDALVRDVDSTVATFITTDRPDMGRNSFVSADDFINDAYARATDMQFKVRYQEAQRLFQVITEQVPELFWPRYEYALAARDLQDTETAERLFLELREASENNGNSRHLAAVLNSLGIMYMGQRRNDEARLASYRQRASGQAIAGE